jgi:uncharacterized protein (DUF1697 family)
MTAYVALLRGVNVGGARGLPMVALRTLFENAGGRGVETLIQSGNVIFESDENSGAAVVAAVGAAISREFGFDAPIVLRSARQWRALIDGNPYLQRGVDPKVLHAACLSALPDPARGARLDPHRSAPDEFELRGETIYLNLPNGVARSKLTNAWFDSTLGVVCTMRNWATVTRLARLLEARPSSLTRGPSVKP